MAQRVPLMVRTLLTNEAHPSVVSSWKPNVIAKSLIEFNPTFWETPLQSQWEVESLPECNSLIIVKWRRTAAILVSSWQNVRVSLIRYTLGSARNQTLLSA